MATYTYPTFPYHPPHDLMQAAPRRKPLVVIGAGPVGLAAAIDARLHGLDVLLFDEEDRVSFGSRAVCYAKRALEILDRLGVGDPVVDRAWAGTWAAPSCAKRRSTTSTWCPKPATNARA